jgi:hypothetical protein
MNANSWEKATDIEPIIKQLQQEIFLGDHPLKLPLPSDHLRWHCVITH